MSPQRPTNRLDLTEGQILKTLIRLAVPVTVSMVMFSVYLLVDLYFVGRLGPDAVAALSISGNAFFIHLGFSTILGTGAVFQGIGKTYSSLILDNALFACLVFTVPAYFNRSIQSVWWLKLTTAAIEMAVVAAWLKRELFHACSGFADHFLDPGN
jgi:Na+-driven multidrug efflux pump